MDALAFCEIAQEHQSLVGVCCEEGRSRQIDDAGGQLSQLLGPWFALGDGEQGSPSGNADNQQQAEQKESTDEQRSRENYGPDAHLL